MNAAEILARVAAYLSLILEGAAAINQAVAVLQQAQAEGWADTDIRWKTAFDDLNAALAVTAQKLGLVP